MPQFLPLTSLRLFFALWVLCRHWLYSYEGSGPLFDIGVSSAFFDRGYLGVDGFFVLSGFILTYNYDSPSGMRRDWSEFIVARIARIYPAYIVCLCAMAVAVVGYDWVTRSNMLGSANYSASGLFLELFMLSAWRYAGSGGWNDVGWSVSAEWFAYVCFPIFLFAAPRLNPRRILLAAGCMFAVLAIVEVTSPDHLALSGGLARLVPEFMLGVLLCRLRRVSIDYHGYRWAALLSTAVCAVGIALHADTLFVLGAAGMILSLSYRKDALAKVLSFRLLVFLGEISYCIYIVQRIPQYFFGFGRSRIPYVADMPGAMQALLLLSITIAAAILLHFTVEKPMRSWINRQFGATRRRTQLKAS
ncbi:acyltransferase family protein [Cupriavidus oxalaticus]|uniref:Acyltransferase n=1 Tax=Cupriavidus oxalaticus TaxID=96344 RepID=A0A5P3VRU6_9BURK|nr:acyltransferase [Cupriavidus oxalaticus]QEZ48748.1 acyltransferase [Cupriavidus oxalaticus]